MGRMVMIVREFSAAGPCLTLGKLVRETPRFYVFLPWRGGDKYDEKERKVARNLRATGGNWSPAHVVSCPSCRDHEATQYPNGYMD
jgi:hypothetical protein